LKEHKVGRGIPLATLDHRTHGRICMRGILLWLIGVAVPAILLLFIANAP
jgi:hypothetical protein